MEKKQYIERALSWARSRRISNIKANLEEEEIDRPKSFAMKGKDKSLVPDITGNKLSKKIYVEVALKAEKVQKVVSKWKLLSTLAARKGGKLFLLAPRGHKAFAERILKKYDLPNAQVIALH